MEGIEGSRESSRRNRGSQESRGSSGDLTRAGKEGSKVHTKELELVRVPFELPECRRWTERVSVVEASQGSLPIITSRRSFFHSLRDINVSTLS